MAEFPALPLWTDAFLGDTTHLDAEETGAYLMLLIVAWRSPDCALPDDDVRLARWARCTPRRWARLRPVLEDFFTISGARWSQKRLVDEFRYVREKREAAAANGRASALKRKGRHSTKRATKVHAGDEQSDQQTANEKPTPTPTPTSEGKPSATDAAVPDVEKAADAHLWKAGKEFLISRGVPKGQVGGLIGKWKGEYGTGKVIEAIGRAQTEPDLVDPIPFIQRVLQNSRGRNFDRAGKEYLGV